MGGSDEWKYGSRWMIGWAEGWWMDGQTGGWILDE